MIEVKNLCKTYKPKKGKEVKALKNINLKFEETGLVFILGKSGSGKSTLLNMLGGLDKFDEGEIIIKGKSSENFTQSDFDSYRNTFIGFIFQEYNILNDFTVGANIALSMELQGKKPSKTELNNILNDVDLDGYGSRKPNELSGGQKQRVAIARALIKNPEIIMADEPTGALDSNTGKQVFDTLKKLSKDKLVIVVSHDRDFAEQYGDRVIELSDGEVISDIKKYIAKPSNLTEGIDIIEDKIIHIKSGYELTQNDLDMINEYLRNNKNSDSFISIDSKTNDEIKKAVKIDADGNREDFCSTSDDNLEIYDYSPDDFKLIRSKLPLKNSLKMALGSLKKKPFRLIMTIFLSTVAFSLFGLVNTMSSYDPVNSGTDSIIDSDVDYAAFTKESYQDFGGYGYYMNKLLSDEDVDRIKKKFPKFNFNTMITPDNSTIMLSENIFDEEAIAVNGYMYYITQFSGISDADENALNKMGYTITGSLPKADNEIAITKFTAETFVEAGYRKEPTQDKAITIDKASDMIGKTLSLALNGHSEYTITGIVDTNYNVKRYENYKEEIKGQRSIKDYIMMSEKQTVDAYSYHSVAFTTSNVYTKTLENNIGISSFGDNYYANFIDNETDYNTYTIDKIVEFGKANENVMKNVVMFEDKTTLAENEIIIPMSILADDSELYMQLSDNIENIDDIESIKKALTDKKTDIIAIPLMSDFNTWTNEYMGTPKKLQIVGVYIDNDLNNTGLSIMYDGIYNDLGTNDDGKYKALLTALPESKEDIAKLVKYSLDNDIKNIKYPLNNCTSYTLSMVNSAISQTKNIFLYIGIFFAIFAAIMLMNFIATSISYKKREIGILRAVGARGADVFKIFFNESLIIALINWILASAVTAGIAFFINRVGREQYNLVITILHFGIIQLALMLIISVSVAFVSSFIPVFKVSKKKPIEVIRKN
ncbi:MAG: ATP-binding cassette domain-containing protein [Lachnospiraceae bacterium]|nr:ATP-binding cassette domain-containing protein [Lachnospiraceae bacterium]